MTPPSAPEIDLQKSVNLHIYPSPCTRESRMFRVTKALAKTHAFKNIYLVGVNEPGLPDHEDMDDTRRIIRIPRSRIYKHSRFLGRVLGTLQWSWAVWSYTREMDVACINAHSLPVLPLCVALKWRHGAKLVYDTHELETETISTHGVRKKLAKFTERMLIDSVDHIFCVGDKIADWYQAHYRILRPTVVRNIPEEPVKSDHNNSLRQRFSIPDDHFVFSYAGLLAKDRGIDELLDIFSRVKPDRHLVIIGSGPDENNVKAIVADHPNMHHIPAVPSSEVVSYLTGADAGISMDIRGCLSYLYSLPNKFFEYVYAGIPVLVGGMPEQRDIVEKYDIGWVTPLNQQSMVDFIDNLTAADIARKAMNVANAQAHLNWPLEEKTLLGAYRTLMATKNAA